MNVFFGYPYDFMSEQKKMTVWAISKLLDGLSISDVKEILECIKITMSKTAVWSASREELKQASEVLP